MTTKGTHKYEAMTVHDDGGVAVRVLLWRDNAIIAEIPIEDWCELDAVKEHGGETDDEAAGARSSRRRGAGLSPFGT